MILKWQRHYQFYGGWFLPCRISVFSGRKRERSQRENPPNGDFGGFSHGDIRPRQAKIRQTVKHATHEMSRTFVWRGEKTSCTTTKKSPFGGVLRGAFSHFRPENTLIRHDTNQPPYSSQLFMIQTAFQHVRYKVCSWTRDALCLIIMQCYSFLGLLLILCSAIYQKWWGKWRNEFISSFIYLFSILCKLPKNVRRFREHV